MSGKVIDIDPTKRLTKEAFEAMKAFILSKDFAEIDSLTVMYRSKKGGVNLLSYGLDFDVLGRSQTMLAALGHNLLMEEMDKDPTFENLD